MIRASAANNTDIDKATIKVVNIAIGVMPINLTSLYLYISKGRETAKLE